MSDHKGYSLEVLRRVYDDDSGAYIEVGPDRDGLDLVEVRTTTKDTVMHPKQARLLAKALLACADELDHQTSIGAKP